MAALGSDARRVRRDRIELARRHQGSAALRHFGDARVRRPRRRRARERSERVALERPVTLQRTTRQGVWLHGPRWKSARRVALSRRSAGCGEAGGCDGLPVIWVNDGRQPPRADQTETSFICPRTAETPRRGELPLRYLGETAATLSLTRSTISSGVSAGIPTHSGNRIKRALQSSVRLIEPDTRP